MKQDLANGRGIGYSVFGGQGYDKGDAQKILDLNTAFNRGVKPAKAWATTMGDASIAAQNATRNCLRTKDTLKDLANGMQTTTVASKAATLGLKALSVVGNIGISLVISALAKGFDYLIHYEERQIEKTNELIQQSQEQIDKYEEESNAIDDLTDKYEELSQKSDRDLSTNEELLGIQKEINSLVEFENGVIKDKIDNLDLVNGKRDEEIAKLREIARLEKYGDGDVAKGRTEYLAKYNAAHNKINKVDLVGIMGSGKKIYSVSTRPREVVETALGDAHIDENFSDKVDNIDYHLYLKYGQNDELTESLGGFSYYDGVTFFLDKNNKSVKTNAQTLDFLEYTLSLFQDEGLTDNGIYSDLVKKYDKLKEAMDEAKSAAYDWANYRTEQYILEHEIGEAGHEGETVEEYVNRMLQLATAPGSYIYTQKAYGELTNNQVEDLLWEHVQKWYSIEYSNYKKENQSDRSSKFYHESSLSDLEKVSDNIGKLSTAYKELNDNGYITTKTINEVKEATGLSGDEWTAYENELLNAKKGSTEFNQVMSDLTYKIIENQVKVGDLTNATDEEVAEIEKKIAATLRENGVTNAEALSMQIVNAEKAKAAIKSKALATIVGQSTEKFNQESQALIAQASAYGLTTGQMVRLIAQETIFNNTSLSVSDKINAITKIAAACNIATTEFEDFNEAIANFGKPGDGQAKRDYAKKHGITINENTGKYLSDGRADWDYIYDGVTYDTIEEASFAKKSSDFLSKLDTLTDLPQYGSTSSKSSSSDKNDALEDFLDQAERRYKIHQNELKYIDELEYALSHLVKTEKEQQDVLDDIEEARKDYADNQIEDLEHLIDLENNLYGEGNAPTLRERLNDLGNGGNVNLSLRPQIDTSELNNKGWDAGTGTATVFSSTISNSDFEDLLSSSVEDTVAINFTPIIIDPITGGYKGVLSEDELYSYAHDVIAGIRNDDLNLQIGAEFVGRDAINKAVNAANEIHLLHESFINGISLDDSVVLAYYDRIQEIAHNEAERLRSKGYDDNSDEVQSQQQNWWDAEEKKLKLQEQVFDKAIDSIQHEREMLLNNDPDANVKDLLKEEQNLLHQKAEFYRAIDPMKFTDEIAKLENEWWSIQDELDDSALQAYEKLREKEISQLELKYNKEQSITSALEKQYDVTRQIRDKRMELEAELASSKSLPEYIEDNSTLFNDKDYKTLTRELDRVDKKIVGLYNDYRKEINNLANDEWYKQEEITAQFERQLDVAMERYELAEKELDIAKKRLEYDNILKQRDTRVMVAGGWRQVADPEKLKEASLAKVQAEKEKENLLLTQAENATLRSMQSVSDSTNTLKASVENISTILDNLSKGALSRFARTLDIDVINDYLSEINTGSYSAFGISNAISTTLSPTSVSNTPFSSINTWDGTVYTGIDVDGNLIKIQSLADKQSQSSTIIDTILKNGGFVTELMASASYKMQDLFQTNLPFVSPLLQQNVKDTPQQYIFNGDIVLTETISNGDEFIQSLTRATTSVFDTTKNMRK